jgi:hypothetical protein
VEEGIRLRPPSEDGVHFLGDEPVGHEVHPPDENGERRVAMIRSHHAGRRL